MSRALTESLSPKFVRVQRDLHTFSAFAYHGRLGNDNRLVRPTRPFLGFRVPLSSLGARSLSSWYRLMLNDWQHAVGESYDLGTSEEGVCSCDSPCFQQVAYDGILIALSLAVA